MLNRTIVAAMILTGLLLCSCGASQKTHYYLLKPIQETADSQGKAYSVGVGPIEVAEFLQRPQLITTENNAILYNDFHRWGEPLASAFTRVTAVNLANLLGNNNLVLFPWRSDEVPEVQVRIEVIDLNRIGDEATLTVRWDVDLLDHPSAEIQNLETFRVTAEKEGYESLARAYSELLGKMAAVLAENIERLKPTE